MTERAKEIIGWVIAKEGGEKVSNHAADPGGITKYGIAARSHPGVDIVNLTRAQAEAIYEREYLIPSGADRMAAPLDLAVLDLAVHSGVARAVGTLAFLLELPRSAGLDVILGRLAILNPKVVAAQVVRERAEFLVRLAMTKPGQHVFLVGWMRRLVDLKIAVETA